MTREEAQAGKRGIGVHMVIFNIKNFSKNFKKYLDKWGGVCYTITKIKENRKERKNV